MDNSIEIINLDSSPPSSPFNEYLTQKKVSEMFIENVSEDPSDKYQFAISSANIKSNYGQTSSECDTSIENVILDDSLTSNITEKYMLESSPKIQKNSSKSKKTELILEKKKLKELKAQEKINKMKEKAERAALVEKFRQSKPGQCIKYVTVLLDENIVLNSFGKKAIDLFENVEYKYKTVPQKHPFSVTWTREEPGQNLLTLEEKHILFIWSYEKIVNLVKYCTLIDTFREFKKIYDGFRIYLAICDKEKYYKRNTIVKNRSLEESSSYGSEISGNRKRRRTMDVEKDQIDMSLAELEITLKISTRSLKNHQELSLFLQQITKAIAETPHRKEIEKRDMEKCWFARGDSRDCVKIDKDYNGLYRLWLQHLQQFNKSSLDIAKSIAEFYPSPFALYQAYQAITSQQQKDLLLRDIHIKKGRISTRRIGPELSKKVCLLYSQVDGEKYLSQE